MDLEKRVEGDEEEGAPPKAQELLAAVQEFDRKCDPLDISPQTSPFPSGADALRAGRKLSRLARRVAQAEIEGAKTAAGGWTKAQLAAWGVPWPPPKGWKVALAAQLAEGSHAEEVALDILETIDAVS